MKYLLNASNRIFLNSNHQFLNYLNRNFVNQIQKYSSKINLTEHSFVTTSSGVNDKNDRWVANLNLIKKTSSLNSLNEKKSFNFSSSNNSESGNSSSSSSDPFKKASLEQLLLIKEKLTHHLPKFLNETHPYNLYSPDVVFENFYKEPGKITVGALQYAIQLTMLRLKVHWKYSHARLDVLKITHDESDSTIKIRWRIVGIRGVKSMIQPWKIKAWKVDEAVKNEAEWLDGFSILYVRGNGLIYKHTLERVMSQKDEEPVLVKDKANKKAENLDVGPTICTKQTI